uniref:uncharacterized protein isoform X3 n=1 Tax=Pristiophorus japonicus TaxID=55135 RepID=UPI00398E4C8E
MERHRRSKAKQFSDTALAALVHGVQRRSNVLFSQGGKRLSISQRKRVWKEIAKAVTEASTFLRTPIQCRKRFHDLIRLVKVKVADNRGEQQQAGGDQARVGLTDLEQSVFQIIEGAETGTESVENGELESSTDDDNGMERHQPSRAMRFSDTTLEALVDGAQRRCDILFPQDGEKPSKLQCGRVWKEIAKAVTAASVVPRTRIQCRKRLDDLIQLVKVKVADNRGEQQQAGDDQARADLTDQEESMFQINEGAGTEFVEDGEAESSTDDDGTQEPPATDPEHKENTYVRGEAQDDDDDDKMQQRLTPVDTSSALRLVHNQVQDAHLDLPVLPELSLVAPGKYGFGRD